MNIKWYKWKINDTLAANDLKQWVKRGSLVGYYLIQRLVPGLVPIVALFQYGGLHSRAPDFGSRSALTCS